MDVPCSSLFLLQNKFKLQIKKTMKLFLNAIQWLAAICWIMSGLSFFGWVSFGTTPFEELVTLVVLSIGFTIIWLFGKNVQDKDVNGAVLSLVLMVMYCVLVLLIDINLN